MATKKIKELRATITNLQQELYELENEKPQLINNHGGMFWKNLSIIKQNKSSIILEDKFGNQYINRTTRFIRADNKMKHFERIDITDNRKGVA